MNELRATPASPTATIREVPMIVNTFEQIAIWINYKYTFILFRLMILNCFQPYKIIKIQVNIDR